jgi:DNA phosphorothioation-associated putative methyltransferase
MTSTPNGSPPIVQRHRTAIRRPDLSLPVKCLFRDGILQPNRPLFDYGCGYGEDIERLQALGIPTSGWDPVHKPEAPIAPADIVNLGYVINVIEDPAERIEVLRKAWDLCGSLLVVSAIGADDLASHREYAQYADGILTSRSTFQKHFTHQELRAFLELHLNVDAVPAAPNVYYLFKSEELRQQTLASRFRSRISVPRKTVSEALFEANRDLLEPFMATITQLGRLPGPEEYSETLALIERLGSLKRAFLIVRRATGTAPWTEIADRRRDDLLVYLALSRFGRRRPLSHLPLSVQRDIKAFAGTYARASEEANALLFSVGRPEVIDAACRRSVQPRPGEGENGGQGDSPLRPISLSPSLHSHPFCLVENALLVRRDALDRLEPVLRVYEGCARAVLGEVEEANVVKLHRYSGKVTYLQCDGLDSPAPTVRLRIKVTLPRLAVDVFDYSDWPDPPGLQ